MAQNNNNNNVQPVTSLPTVTPLDAPSSIQPSLPTSDSFQSDSPVHISTPTTFTLSSDQRMYPPAISRNIVTPTHEIREISVLSSGGTARKPRQNLDEHDHLLMVKHCYEQREHYKEGTKAQFWTRVGSAFQRDTSKVLAQMSATVGRLVESRRRQISDWEANVIPQKPAGELNNLLDLWMEFLKTHDGDAEEERMRQVDTRRKLEEARKEARRHTISNEALNPQTNQENPQQSQDLHEHSDLQGTPQNQQKTPVSRSYNGSFSANIDALKFKPPSQQQCGDLVILNDHQVPTNLNGFRTPKRKRPSDCQHPRELKVQVEPQQPKWHSYQQPEATQNLIDHHYSIQVPPESARRVIIEGQMTKDDWRDIFGNDKRLRVLETKIEKIETLVVQNNRLLVQLIKTRNKEVEQDSNEKIRAHLGAEFDKDHS